jgi:hypothetical protein
MSRSLTHSIQYVCRGDMQDQVILSYKDMGVLNYNWMLGPHLSIHHSDSSAVGPLSLS